MILYNNIAFVLGAGASKPYGFPTGYELRQRICRMEPNVKKLLLRMGHSEFDLSTFSSAFQESAHLSIDAFIAIVSAVQHTCTNSFHAASRP
jgi:hypothetical protein